jgi:8-oxo-dGTP pyrophosphatase MutT (NUDIX family)
MLVRQVYAFILDHAQAVLVQDDRGRANLPGGKPEPYDSGELETLRRECLEESQVEFREPRYLGYVEIREADVPPYAQLRYAAKLSRLLPPGPDPATGREYGRNFVAPAQLNEALGWGEVGAAQIWTLMELLAKSEQ